jgi:vacuolar-type H+-ATPase subunit H
MDVNSARDFRIARLSAKQAIVVAIIGLVSTVGVATITNLDKLKGKTSQNEDVIGFYEGRASSVELGFQNLENDLKSQIELAEQEGNTDLSKQLKEASGNVRESEVRFQILKKEHIQALRDNQSLRASKILSEANEGISDLNAKLQTPIHGKSLDIWTPSTREAMRFGRRTVKLTVLQLGNKRIPLYGMRGGTQRADVCRTHQVNLLDPTKSAREALP